jgi:DNA invertase Pin-like site-specific DNA recombinase
VKKFIGIYGRVSTGAQSHDSQLREVRAYVSRRWPSADLIEFIDTASGSKFTRLGLDSLMTHVRAGKISMVAIYKLDRLGRSLQHLAQLIGEFETHGCALVSTSQGIDTSESNPAGRLQLNVLSAVAQFEREVIVERVRAGLDAAKERGVTLGRPRKRDTLLPEVAKLIAEGLSARKVAERLQIPVGSAFSLCREAKASLPSPAE